MYCQIHFVIDLHYRWKDSGWWIENLVQSKEIAVVLVNELILKFFEKNPAVFKSCFILMFQYATSRLGRSCKENHSQGQNGKQTLLHLVKVENFKCWMSLQCNGILDKLFVRYTLCPPIANHLHTCIAKHVQVDMCCTYVSLRQYVPVCHHIIMCLSIKPNHHIPVAIW